MRLLAGVVILLAAGAAFPQTAPKLDVLHGDANSSKDFEIRPGISLHAQYDQDGTAYRIEIAPISSAPHGFQTIDGMPLETANGILDEVWPVEIHGERSKPTGSFQSSCAVRTSFSYRDATLVLVEFVCPKERILVLRATLSVNRPNAPVASAAFPQTTAKSDYLHGSASSTKEFEIRPGIGVKAVYGSDGMACTMTIAPYERTNEAKYPSGRIPLDTVNSVLDELLPQETYGDRIWLGSFQTGNSASVADSRDAQIWMFNADFRHLGDGGVELTRIEFKRPLCSPANQIFLN